MNWNRASLLVFLRACPDIINHLLRCLNAFGPHVMHCLQLSTKFNMSGQVDLMGCSIEAKLDSSQSYKSRVATLGL